MTMPCRSRGLFTTALLLALSSGCASEGPKASLPATASTTKIVGEAGKIRVSADLVVEKDRENESFGGQLTTRGVVPILLEIENGEPFSIVVSGTDCVLELWDKRPIRTASVGEVALQILRPESAGSSHGDDPTAVIIGGLAQGTAPAWAPVFVAGLLGAAAYCAAVDCPSPHEAVTREIQKVALPEPARVAMSQSAKGFVFFVAYPPMWQHAKLRIPVYRDLPEKNSVPDFTIVIAIP